MTKIPAEFSESPWRPLLLLNFYRLALASILLVIWLFMRERPAWADIDGKLFLFANYGYMFFAVLTTLAAKFRWPRFNRQLTLQVIGDIAFITALMYASGGVKSGFGLLLVVAIAAASLVSHGRLALFYAALATISVLLEQSWQILTLGSPYEDYTHAVMLSLSFFATAWLAYSFARRTEESEALASQRGIDLANLAEVNQRIIRDMPDGVLVVDHRMHLRQLNEQARALLALPELQGNELALDQLCPAVAGLLRLWMAGSPGNESQFRLVIGGRELQLHFAPVGAGREQGAVVFVSDMSQVQSQAQQLKLAALGRLTANIAHEIRNPLSAIGHATQLLQEEDTADPTQRRLFEIIGGNVQRLDGMVKDVLQLNRRDRARPENIGSEQFLLDFRQQFCQVEKISEEGFVLDLPTEPPDLLFDRHHLHQVLWNLCRNAWRHGRQAAGSLQVRVFQAHGSVKIDVRDDGPGASEESLPHLFEPFFTTESSGTGLGLYIARELCEANGARIEYAGSASGAIFRIHARRPE